MIQLIKVIGKGNTRLSAFDNALFQAGIENRNLIYLSSVIPAGCVVVDKEKAVLDGAWGDKLYVVMAQTTAGVGETASAGIAYSYEINDNRIVPRGLFVEHELVGTKSADEVDTLLRLSLADLFNTRDLQMRAPVVTISTAKNTGEAPYICPMVIAVFEEEGWNTL